VRKRARLFLAIVLGAGTGCAGHRAYLRSEPDRVWSATFLYAKEAVASDRYGAADSALLAFVDRYPATRQASEGDFWRALLALDPRNERHSAADAIRALAAYFAIPAARAHDIEAEVLRRTATTLADLGAATAEAASQVDSARTEADSVRTQADSARLARASRDRTQEQVQRLRDSLDKVVGELAASNQELERIKKHLTAPTP